MSDQFNPNSQEAKDIAYHFHPYTNPTALAKDGPMIIHKGKGVFVYDGAGKDYIEGLAGLWCASFGFSEAELVKAATKQMQELPYYHSFSAKTHNPAINLAEKLVKLAPAGLDKVFFCNSGSEANDTAIKMVWYYQAAIGKPEKHKIISRKRGYHGVTLAAASLTALDYVQKGFGLPLEFAKHTASPHYFLDAKDGESEADFVARCMQELEELIAEEGADTIGAFIAEPVMGAGGAIVHPKGYFEALQPILKKHDILFIADEVICGFGRTGNMWGSDTYNLKPDILTCAKALSSAYLPISAVLVSQAVADGMSAQADKLGQFGHGYTYTGHPVPAAVALRTLELMEERDMLTHIQSVAPLFQTRIQALTKYDSVGDARGVGLIGGIEFVAKPNTRIKPNPAHKVGLKVMKMMQDAGVIIRALPLDGIAFCPPLIISNDEINMMFDRVERAMPAVDELVKNLD